MRILGNIRQHKDIDARSAVGKAAADGHLIDVALGIIQIVGRCRLIIGHQFSVFGEVVVFVFEDPYLETVHPCFVIRGIALAGIATRHDGMLRSIDIEAEHGRLFLRSLFDLAG